MVSVKSKTVVKICGITRPEDARHASGASVDYLGFLFVENTPRYIEPARAAGITRQVKGPQYVGVFMNQSPGRVNTIAAESGIHMVQLHGDETPEDCRDVELPVIKAFRIKPEMTKTDIISMIQPYLQVVSYFLFDAYDKESAGGTGKTFDWSALGDLAGAYPVILAGGLSDANIGRAITLVNPSGVDLSSGVESSPGIKDHARIDALMAAIRRNE